MRKARYLPKVPVAAKLLLWCQSISPRGKTAKYEPQNRGNAEIHQTSLLMLQASSIHLVVIIQCVTN